MVALKYITRVIAAWGDGVLKVAGGSTSSVAGSRLTRIFRCNDGWFGKGGISTCPAFTATRRSQFLRLRLVHPRTAADSDNYDI